MGTDSKCHLCQKKLSAKTSKPEVTDSNDFDLDGDWRQLKVMQWMQ